MAAPPDRPLPRAEAAQLDRIYARLIRGDAAAIPDLDEFERRHPDRLETVRTVAWGLLLARDWTAGVTPPAFDPAPEASRPTDDGIDFVVCHIALPAPPTALNRGTLRTALDPDEHHAQIRRCFDAARRAAPAMRRVLISNPETDLPDDLHADILVRRPIRPAAIMPDRLRAYRDHLDAMPLERTVALFVDADVIACRSPIDAFAEPFSLALTWRAAPPTMPLNAGVVLARRTEGARWLFDRMLDGLAAIAAEARIAGAFTRLFGVPLEGWYGDQVAMAALAGWRRFERPPPAPRVFGPGATLSFLPEDPYNFAVPPAGPHDPRDLARRVLIHFKGRSKGLAADLVPQILAAAR